MPMWVAKDTTVPSGPTSKSSAPNTGLEGGPRYDSVACVARLCSLRPLLFRCQGNRFPCLAVVYVHFRCMFCFLVFDVVGRISVVQCRLKKPTGKKPQLG